MRALSTEDGSAEAVREAAEGGLVQGDHRLALERELDRLNVAVQGSAAALGQHLSWLLVAQAFLLVAYVVVLVGGWNVPLPGKRWLLVGIAAFAAIAVISTYLGLRAARDRVGPLKQHRQRVEDALERVAARPPAFARQGAVTAILSQASTRGLPLLVCAGWGVLALYAFALAPMPSDTRTAAVTSEPRSNGSPSATTIAPSKSARSSPPAAKTMPVAPSEEAPAEASTNTNAPSGSPLVEFLRRAVNTQPAAEPQEPIKP